MEDSGCMNNIDIVRNLVESYGFWIDEIQSAKTDMSFPTGAAGMYSTTTLSLFTTDLIYSSETGVISVPFGKYSRINPFVPRCHGDHGSSKSSLRIVSL